MTASSNKTSYLSITILKREKYLRLTFKKQKFSVKIELQKMSGLIGVSKFECQNVFNKQHAKLIKRQI